MVGGRGRGVQDLLTELDKPWCKILALLPSCDALLNQFHSPRSRIYKLKELPKMHAMPGSSRTCPEKLLRKSNAVT